MVKRPLLLLLIKSFHKVDARFQSFRSFLPLGRADFSIVCGNKLCSFYLAQQLVGIASDVVVLYLGNLDFYPRDLRGMCRDMPCLPFQSSR